MEPDVNLSFLFFKKRRVWSRSSEQGWTRTSVINCSYVKIAICMWMASSHKYHNYLVTPYNVWPKFSSHVFKRWHVCPATSTNANGQGDFTFFSLWDVISKQILPQSCYLLRICPSKETANPNSDILACLSNVLTLLIISKSEYVLLLLEFISWIILIRIEITCLVVWDKQFSRTETFITN